MNNCGTYYDKTFNYSSPSSSEELKNAINNAVDETGNPTKEVYVKIDNPGTYKLPTLTEKVVTITGTEDVVIDMQGAINQASKVQIEGVNVVFANENYKGFQHTGKVIYKDCTIQNLQFLYADEVEFINCKFIQNQDDTYHLWTYTARDVTFTNCEFISSNNSKSVLCYTEGVLNYTLTRTFNNCTFICEGTSEKSAIMINPTAYGVNTYIINIKNCTATGYAENNIAGQEIVGVKNTVKDNIIINVDDITVFNNIGSN